MDRAPAAQMTGHVDTIRHNLVGGWAANLDNLTRPVEVMVIVNGEISGTTVCDLPRPDLAGQLGSIRHGFRYVFPEPLPQNREAHVVVASRDTGQPLPNGRKLLAPSSTAGWMTPILVTAIGRSGTTLLMHLLAQAPEICVADLYPYELRFLSYYATAFKTLTNTADWDRSMHPDRLGGDGFTVGFNPFFHSAFRSMFRRTGSHTAFFSGAMPCILGEAFRKILLTLYTKLAEDKGKRSVRFFAEKNNNLDQQTRDFAREAFGAAKEIVLVRNPMDLLVSRHAYFKTSDDEAAFADLLAGCRTIMNMRTNAKPDMMFLRYEDMILQPEETFARLSDFLGTHVVPDTTQAVENVFREHATSKTPESSIGRGRRELNLAVQKRAEAAFASFATTFGY
jgi:hypothetical protein